MCIISSHTSKSTAQTITAVPAAGMARKRSYHLQPRCWNEHRWFKFSGEFQTALLNWLCKTRKEVVVSLPNFLCILISRSLSNLKLKYTRVFKHKLFHNCITHSKVSRNIMAADAGNVPQLRAIITSHTVCGMHVQDDVQAYWTPLQQLRFWIHLMTVSMLNTALVQYLKQGCTTFFVGGPYNQLQTSSWATRKI